MEIFCNIINVFIVTFDQFIVSLINKSLNYLEYIPSSNKSHNSVCVDSL